MLSVSELPGGSSSWAFPPFSSFSSMPSSSSSDRLHFLEEDAEDEGEGEEAE